MTKEQFSKLKVGDIVYLPNQRSNRASFTSTEVLEIDRLFGKVKVLLNNKLLSYRYIPLEVGIGKVTGYVGICRLPAYISNKA